MSYLRCEGSITVSPYDPAAFQCSTGFVEVQAEPLLSREQSEALLGSVMMLVVVILIWKELAGIFR